MANHEIAETNCCHRRKNGTIAAAALLLLAAAVVKELRVPADERTWVGKIGGIIPYDLRPPTIERVRASMWSPDDERIVMPYAFGVGWTVNLGRLVRLARRGGTAA